MELMDWITLSIASIGAITGIISLILYGKKLSIMNKEHEIKEDNRKKAKFQVRRTSKIAPNKLQMDYLNITNLGETDAKNVDIDLIKKNPMTGEISNAKHIFDPNEIPSTINSQQEVILFMNMDTFFHHPFQLIIYWDDNFQKNNKKEYKIN